VLATILPHVFNTSPENRGILIGPIPAGFPISLLANLQVALDSGSTLDQLKLDRQLLSAVLRFGSALNEARGKSDEEARRIVFSPEVVDGLMNVSKCPDYIVNRGHYFGTEMLEGEAPLSNEERNALIEYLRTF